MVSSLYREFSSALLVKSESWKVLLLTGMRQVGKTTLLKKLVKSENKNRTYVTLDNADDLILAKNSPTMFLKKYKLPIIIDEIQYAPELFSHIKELVDLSEERGLVWLTGSQQFHLMSNIKESLAGRVGIYQLLGLSLSELEGDITTKHEPFLPNFSKFISKQDKTFDKNIFNLIHKGSYPDIALGKNKEWADFYSSYIKTYLDRDLRDLKRIEDPIPFYRFLKVVAGRTGQELNMADIARDSDISPHTAKSYLKVLETSGVIYLLEPYYNNINKRITKMPKLYFLDTGLACYLTAWLNPDVLENGAFAGQIFETFIFCEIYKSYLNHGLSPKFYFYRDVDKAEIDLLILSNNTFYPIEIKKSANAKISDIKHFAKLEVVKQQGFLIGDGAVIYMGDKIMPITDTVIAIPFYHI